MFFPFIRRLFPKIEIIKDSQFILLKGKRKLNDNYGKWIIVDNLDNVKKYVNLL